jgi:membrane protease YdiL (CAAX protease family)
MMNYISTSEPEKAGPERFLGLLKRHPLVSYFVLAFALTWISEVLTLVVWHLPELLALIPGPFVGPTLSAFLLTGLLEGKAGVRRLLARYVLWRVSVQWYFVVLLGLPVVILLGALLLPGALSAFHIPTLAFGLHFLGLYLTIFFLGGPLGEEPGWRGFALPRLERRFGPLFGSLILGILHALWHLPLFLLIPGYDRAGAGWLGISLSFGEFLISVAGLTFIFTWVFNNTRGSLLMTMLLHASTNTATTVLLLFPSLIATRAVLNHIQSFVMVVVALLLIVVTRGRLSYRRYQREVLTPR